MILNCFAVDDEPLGLGLVCAFIGQTPFLNLLGKFSSGVEALRGLHEQQPDVIFLDIQMSDLNGLELARVLDGRDHPKPRIIFTTAYNQFALEGYRVDALDYLLKPFNYEEFLHAANKALAFATILQKSKSVVAQPEDVVSDEYLFIKVEYQLVRVALSNILYIESLKDYVKVWLENEKKPLLSLTSLKALEDKLPPKRFMRVHRSFIVSLEKINFITRSSMQIGTINITVGDQYKDAFSQFLSRWV